MTKGEAASILNVSLEADFEEIEEQFEQLLFERKKFFLQKTPIHKLFEPKLRSIQQIIKAYELLSEEKLDNVPQLITSDFQFDSSNLLMSFNTYHQYRNQLKQKLINASHFNDIEQVTTELMKLESTYASFWYHDELDTQQTIVGAFPDEIELLSSLKKYLELGGKSFEDLKKMKNNPPEILIQEMKRLSLLYKNYRWTKS